MDHKDVPNLIAEVDRQARRVVRPYSVSLVMRHRGQVMNTATVFRCEFPLDAREVFVAVEKVLRQYRKKHYARERRQRSKSRPTARWAV